MMMMMMTVVMVMNDGGGNDDDFDDIHVPNSTKLKFSTCVINFA